MYFSNQRSENIKMYLRCLYAMGCWYEPLYLYYLGQYDEGWVFSKQQFDDDYLNRKLGLIILVGLCTLWNLVDKCCMSGTRTVVSFGGFWVVVHSAVALSPAESPYVCIINNSVFTMAFFYWYMRWLEYGESDMKSFQTHGPFRPGLKRFKSEHGNDCMAFYPVNKSIPSL